MLCVASYVQLIGMYYNRQPQHILHWNKKRVKFLQKKSNKECPPRISFHFKEFHGVIFYGISLNSLYCVLIGPFAIGGGIAQLTKKN